MARIMVVNDTQEILEAFRDILEEEGYEVLLYSYAIMDMREIEEARPDLMILDYIFGSEKTGWQMLQKLKMHRATDSIPIIVCTAATREVRDIEGYLQAHGIALVPKPFDIDMLLNSVKRALQMPHTTVDLSNKRHEERLDANGRNPDHAPSHARRPPDIPEET